MDIRTVNVIVSREYLTRVKKKSFLLTTFLGPVFFAALCILPSLIMLMAEDKDRKIGVVDESGIVMPYMADNVKYDFIDYSSSKSAIIFCSDLLYTEMYVRAGG